MSVKVALSKILHQYQLAKREPLADHPLAEFVRGEVPISIKKSLVEDARYIFQGSVGQGNWAAVPWIAVFNRFITHTAQKGYYIVYLVKEDCSGIYISLNQGVTTIKERYGADAKDALRAKATDYLAQLGQIDSDFMVGPIDLQARGSSSLGAFYEKGSICAKYYPKEEIPDNDVLVRDLRRLLQLYSVLALKELIPSFPGTEEEDELGLGQENLITLREHKRIERNRKLAESAKRAHGYTCEACGFNFEETYGEIGKGFIEAHHLTPLNKLRGQLVTLDARRDFAMLCSNCHRMIHRSEFESAVAEFSAKYVLKPNN